MDLLCPASFAWRGATSHLVPGGLLFFFSKNGVEIIKAKDVLHPKYTWCFVDSKYADQLPPTIHDPYDLVIMNPWTKAELERA